MPKLAAMAQALIENIWATVAYIDGVRAGNKRGLERTRKGKGFPRLWRMPIPCSAGGGIEDRS